VNASSLSGALAVDPRARAAWPFLPAFTRPGRVYQGPTGELVVTRIDGGADPVPAGGRPRAGIAADPVPGLRGLR
jgi:hypothetical protein